MLGKFIFIVFYIMDDEFNVYRQYNQRYKGDEVNNLGF